MRKVKVKSIIKYYAFTTEQLCDVVDSASGEYEEEPPLPEDDGNWSDEPEEPTKSITQLEPSIDPEVESNQSSVTLSSTHTTKRGRDDAEDDDEYEYEAGAGDSPGKSI
jgi:hypothetical protein